MPIDHTARVTAMGTQINRYSEIIEDIVSRITLRGGKVMVRENVLEGVWVFGVYLKTDPRVCEHEDTDAGKKVKILTDFVIRIELLNSLREEDIEPLVLSQVQACWSSLHAHESLETFLYKKDGETILPFDPHYTDSMRPLPCNYLQDTLYSQKCRIVEPVVGVEPTYYPVKLGTEYETVTGDGEQNGNGAATS